MDRSLKQKKYILYEYNYDDTIGGTIVMHKLCDLLNHYGYEAYMWQSELEKGFKTNQYLKTPIINIDNLDEVYKSNIIEKDCLEDISASEIIKLLDEHPELTAINKHIEQKKLKE